MKTAIAIIAAIIILCPCPYLIAQTAAGETSYATVPFSITFLGTRYRSDIESIVSNIKKSPRVKNFTPTVISQQNIRYSGTFEGPAENLSLDINNLSTDRFSVQQSGGIGEPIQFTLSKMKNSPSSY